VFNVYVPASTKEISAQDLLPLKTAIGDLLLLYPGDSFLVAGDLNCDRYKPDTTPSAKMK
jgi:hypothetical protein